MTAVASEWTGATATAQDAAAEAAAFRVTPEYVNSLTVPTETFLCPLSHNVYNICFKGFKVRALHENTETVFADVKQPAGSKALVDDSLPDSVRSISYNFGPHFLDYSTVGTTLEFTNGDYPLENFQMIERHYFRDQLIRSYDFSMPFVMPGTTNTWEVIYSMPELSPEWKAAVIAYPWEMRSDTFHFVNGYLVMHHKAQYSYAAQ